MYTFVDLMRQAQNGQAVENWAAQFGLRPADVDALMKTLLPVYAMGFRREASAADPFGLLALARQGPFRAAFESADAAASAAAIAGGRAVLERLFGSGEVARAIADQAARMTGIGAEVVRKLMPQMASTLFGGLGASLDRSPLADAIDAWATSIGTLSGGADPGQVNPAAAAMGAFFRGYAEGKPKPKAEAPRWPDGMEDFGRMFDAGLELQEQSRKAFEHILDGMTPGR